MLLKRVESSEGFFWSKVFFLIAWLRLLWKYSGFHVALARRWLFANLTATVCSQLKLLKDAPPQVCIFYCLLLSNFTLIRLHDDLLCCLNPKGPSYRSQGYMGNFFCLILFTYWSTHAILFTDSVNIKYVPICHNMINRVALFKSMNPRCPPECIASVFLWRYLMKREAKCVIMQTSSYVEYVLCTDKLLLNLHIASDFRVLLTEYQNECTLQCSTFVLACLLNWELLDGFGIQNPNALYEFLLSWIIFLEDFIDNLAFAMKVLNAGGLRSIVASHCFWTPKYPS